MWKDKPIATPFRILNSSAWLDPSRLGWATAVIWTCISFAATMAEPLPIDLDMNLTARYAIQTLAVSIVSHLLLAASLSFLRKDISVGTMVRVGLGANLVWLWTTPIAWMVQSQAGYAILNLGREFLWAVVVTRAIAPSIPKVTFRYSLLAVGAPILAAAAIVLQSIPDLIQSEGLSIDQISSGRVSTGKPEIYSQPGGDAAWTLEGPDALLTPERIRLGNRQTILSSSPGKLEVLVTAGSTGAPDDTAGTATPEPDGTRNVFSSFRQFFCGIGWTNCTDARPGPELAALLSSIPNGSDSLRLLQLHTAVHQSIRYERKFFNGSASEILRFGKGDCKAYAKVFCQAARQMGYRARVVHGLLASPDGWYAHAWVTVLSNGQWHDWDPTSPYPFPDSRYLRFAPPAEANGAFDGELAIFTLKRIETRAFVR